jgi:hypothetical protein
MKAHHSRDCWCKESNKSKRPTHFNNKLKKKNSETAATGVDGGTQEFLLSAKEFENPTSDPDFWIANTAATVHMTPYRNGLVNIKKLPESDVITMGNGSQEEAKEVADVIGTIHHQGKQSQVRIQDVTLLTNGHFKCSKKDGNFMEITNLSPSARVK